MLIIGTSGFHFADWAGRFYPVNLVKEQWLEYYSEKFPALEINTTYYGLPKRETVSRWVEQTPDGFDFFVKLNKESTHLRENDGEEVAELLDRLSPLADSKKLKGLLAQFPASFHAGVDEERYLAALASHLKGIRLFVEFRHYSWNNDQAVSLCHDLNLGWVAVDQPNLPGLATTRPAVTSDTGYIRFHGRNNVTWYNPQAGDRYDWDYTDRELLAWIPRLRSMAQRAETTYLFFNNCHAGQAIKSALRMKQLLRDQFEVL